jgi:hypothetical protein
MSWTCDWSPAPSDEAWLRTSFHEAGHAAAYLSFGWPFRSVRVFRDKGNVRGQTLIQDVIRDHQQFAVAALAGPVAAARFTGEDPLHLLARGGSDDFVMAMDARARIHARPSQAALLAQAQRLVTAEWPRIEVSQHCRIPQ